LSHEKMEPKIREIYWLAIHGAGKNGLRERGRTFEQSFCLQHRAKGERSE